MLLQGLPDLRGVHATFIRSPPPPPPPHPRNPRTPGMPGPRLAQGIWQRDGAKLSEFQHSAPLKAKPVAGVGTPCPGTERRSRSANLAPRTPACRGRRGSQPRARPRERTHFSPSPAGRGNGLQPDVTARRRADQNSTVRHKLEKDRK